MTKAELPEGIASDNNSRSSMSDGEFRAPDMATPHFSKRPLISMPSSTDSTTNRASHRVAHDDYQEDDEDEMMAERSNTASPSGGGNNLIMLISIIALLAIGAGVFMIKSQNTLPLCSTQPDWNQYNCRAG